MNAIKKAWLALQKLARPFDSQIVKEEPAICSAVVGIATNIGLNLGFTLTPGESSTLAALTLLAVGAFTRQSVTPTSDTSARNRRAVSTRPSSAAWNTDGGLYPPPAFLDPQDAASVGDTGG